MSAHIHPSAIIDPTAQLGENVNIGPYSIVGPQCQIGDHCQIASHAVLHERTILGENSFVDCHAVLGGNPNFIGFDPRTPSGVRIGKEAILREFTTIHRSVEGDSYTTVGDHFFLMPNAHVAHDCIVGNHVVLANAALLGGHVTVNDYVFLGGGSAVHQFCRLGEGAMIAGLAAVSYDVAPYTSLANRNELHGLNIVGLRRRKASMEAVRELKELYRLLLQSGGKAEEVATSLPSAQTKQGSIFIEFFKGSKRGYAKSTRIK